MAETFSPAPSTRRIVSCMTPAPLVQRWLGVVAAIGAGVVALLLLSSSLVNRKVAWTSGAAAAAHPLPKALHFADTSALFAAVDSFAEDEIQAGRVPGFALALVHDGRIVHERGFGKADARGRPVTPETPFILGSLSKSVTALAVLQLVDEGSVALDAPVRTYLTWFELRDHRAAATITVRQLLNHTSGLPKSAGLRLAQGNEAVTREQERRLLAHVRLAHPPGRVFEYSNANYWLLGLIVEAASKRSFAAYVEEHIFQPLGMTHTFTSELEADRNGLAQGYRIWFGYPRAEHMPFYWRELAAGYLISSADDMARYLIAQLHAGEDSDVISAAAGRAMQTPPPNSPYGMGWLADTVAGAPVLWHTGAVANFHGDMLVIPSRGWGVVQLANVNNFLLEDQLSGDIQRIAALLLGYEPPPRSWRTFRLMYAIVVAIGLAWASWRIAQIVELRHWRGALSRVSESLPASPRERPHRHPSGALIDPGVSIGLHVGIPLLLGTPLSTLRWFAPDVTAWLTVNAIASIVIMVLRLTLAMAPPVQRPTTKTDPGTTSNSSGHESSTSSPSTATVAG